MTKILRKSLILLLMTKKKKKKKNRMKQCNGPLTKANRTKKKLAVKYNNNNTISITTLQE